MLSFSISLSGVTSVDQKPAVTKKSQAIHGTPVDRERCGRDGILFAG